MSEKPNLPWWLKLANPAVMAANSLGLSMGPVQVLSVPGRRSGKLRSTPVTPITVNSNRYITTVGDTQWVKNARVAGWGVLARGRNRHRIGLVELPPEQRGAILREFPRQAPQGIRFYQQAIGITGDPESFAAAAPRCRVFQVVENGMRPQEDQA
ncbi:MAG TPA: hypothetical protein VFO27_03985 [Bryobacteraceae bacterium]|nr:hypothetical protein [Bryobacteraceae bacterium]